MSPDPDVRSWLELPEVVHAVNRRVTEVPDLWPLTAFASLIKTHLPVRRALSLGCGTGALEREFMKLGGARLMYGVDISEGSLEEARTRAADMGFAGAIQYTNADAATWLETAAVCREVYDLVFFNGSLHHIEELERVLAGCADRLRSGTPGWMYVDEYVGPSRGQWTEQHLEHARAFFERLPPESRRTMKLWPPIAMDDPTEMVRSSEIDRLLRRFFEVLHYRPYFGNVVCPLISAIKATWLPDPGVRSLIREAIAREDELIERGELTPFFAVYALRPR